MVKNKWISIIIVLVIFSLISLIVAGILSFFMSPQGISSGPGNVAVIDIKGTIVVDSNDNLFSDSVASSTDIVKLIEAADENPNIKAILFNINSGGGSPVASDEIAQAIKNTNKTTVSLIREMGASGAYWIASATDYIIASRMSITGSIGVYSSYLEFSGFLNDKNISYNLIKGGKYKNVGSPFKELTDEERNLIQEKIDKIHDFFIDEVAQNRNMSEEDVRELANGMWYLGVEAKDLGLVDELGGKKEAKAYLKENIGEDVEFVNYGFKKSVFDSLFGISDTSSYYIGKGIGESLIKEEKGIRV